MSKKLSTKKKLMYVCLCTKTYTHKQTKIQKHGKRESASLKARWREENWKKIIFQLHWLSLARREKHFPPRDTPRERWEDGRGRMLFVNLLLFSRVGHHRCKKKERGSHFQGEPTSSSTSRRGAWEFIHSHFVVCINVTCQTLGWLFSYGAATCGKRLMRIWRQFLICFRRF